jgi:hypothetical protein
MTLFSDASVWREANQWKAVFGSMGIGDTNTQLFANFGSVSETISPTPDVSLLAARITEQFAMDVFAELKNDISTQFRSSRTSQGNREGAGRPPPAPQRTLVITPHNSRRVGRVGHGTAPTRDRSQTGV